MPSDKDLPNIQAFIKERRYKITAYGTKTGLLERDGEYFPIDALPQHLHHAGHLVLNNVRMTRLPANLTVTGSLVLSSSNISEIGDDLKVGGNMMVAMSSDLAAMPNKLHVSGNLDILSGIRKLPQNLYVGKNFTLKAMFVSRLPKHLCVRGERFSAAASITNRSESNALRNRLLRRYSTIRFRTVHLLTPSMRIDPCNDVRLPPSARLRAKSNWLRKMSSGDVTPNCGPTEVDQRSDLLDRDELIAIIR